MKRFKKIAAVLFIALIVIILLASFLFIKIEVPTASMENTIPVGSRLLVQKTRDINRGDIVMFYSDEEDCYLIKRLIGEPGDVIDIRKGTVYVNGAYLSEPYISTYSEQSGTYYVPDDSYFFLGDNRADSFDSRFWADPYISKRKIIGKAILFLSDGVRPIDNGGNNAKVISE